MDYNTLPVDFPTFGIEHNLYLIVCLLIWIIFAFIGRNFLNKSQQQKVAISLAVFTIFQELSKFNIDTDIYDPFVSVEEVKQEYAINILSEVPKKKYDAIILAVPHNDIVIKGLDFIKSLGKKGFIFFDVKSIFDKKESSHRL